MFSLFNMNFDEKVKEISEKYRLPLGKVKTIYDCCSLILSIVLSFLFFKTFVGVKWGTVVCAVLNGFLIGKIGSFLESKGVFRDGFPWRDKIG